MNIVFTLKLVGVVTLMLSLMFLRVRTDNPWIQIAALVGYIVGFGLFVYVLESETERKRKYYQKILENYYDNRDT